MRNRDATAIRRMINDKKSSLTNAEILLHPEFTRLINEENRQIFKSWMVPGKKLVMKNRGAGVASTDNNQLYINVGHPMFTDISRQKALSYVYGLAFHEIGHVLFTSFTSMKTYFSTLESGYFYPATPVVHEEYAENLAEIKEYIQDKSCAKNLSAVIKELSNIIEDARIEYLLYAFCDNCSKYKIGLKAFNEQLYDKAKDIDFDSMDNGAIMLNQLILIYAQFGEILCDEGTEHYKTILDCLDYIEAAKYAEKSAEFYNNINIVLTICWPIYKEYLDKKQEEAKEKGEESADKDEKGEEQDVSEEISEELSEALEGKSADHVEDEEMADSDGCERREVSEKMSKKPGKEMTEIEDKEINIDALVNRIAKDEADKEWDEQKTLELEDFAKGIDYSDENKNCPIEIIRPTVTDELREMYHSPEIQRFVKIGKDTARKIKKSLPQEKEPLTIKNRVIGSKFDASAVARNDLKYFSKKTKPENGPSLSVGLLVDESGSMRSNGRIESAKGAAIALYSFAKDLNLPVSVYGHTADMYRTKDICLYDYSDFNKDDENNKYRLMAICHRRENRDGAALQYLSERLLATDCDKKLLVVISDGSPVAYNYSGPSAIKDTQEVVKKYSKKGINIIAAAIGGDKENIKRIYGESKFLDISNLSKLPNEMLRIVKRNLKWS